MESDKEVESPSNVEREAKDAEVKNDFKSKKIMIFNTKEK